MDPERRAELAARRPAMRKRFEAQRWAAARADYVRMVPVLASLEAAGDDYRSDNYSVLRGALNLWAHKPDHWLIEHRWALPADPVERDQKILWQLRARLRGGAPVTVILRREDLVLGLELAVLERHLPVLIENAAGRELGFAAPPARWLVEVAGGRIATGMLPQEETL